MNHEIMLHLYEFGQAASNLMRVKLWMPAWARALSVDDEL